MFRMENETLRIETKNTAIKKKTQKKNDKIYCK